MSQSSSSSGEIASSQKNDVIQSSSFYSKKRYLTPLERQELKQKRSTTACEDITNSPPSDDGTRKRKKPLKKSKVLKENEKPKTKKSVQVPDPLVFLSKKEESHYAQEKKFFKSRPRNLLQEQCVPMVTCKSILPMDMKATKALLNDKRNVLYDTLSKRRDRNASLCKANVHTHSKGEKLSPVEDMRKTSNIEETHPHVKNLKTVSAASKWVENSFQNVEKENVDFEFEHTNIQSGDINSGEPVDSSADWIDCSIEGDDGQCQNEGTPSLDGEKELSSNGGKFYSVFHPQKVDSQKNVEKSTSPMVSSKPVRREKLFNEQGEKDQLMIDAGQKEIGAKQCPTCNMVYHVANAADENLHIKFHESFLASLKFNGWKKEHVIGQFVDGRIIMITKEDPHFMLKKVQEVLSIVNRDLGFANPGFPVRPNATFLLFISFERTVVGCLVAESITYAYRVQYDVESGNLIPYKDSNSADEEGKVKAVCGVNRLWVAPEYRSNKIATRMLDCLRCNFLYGYPINLDQLAFLDPSMDGRKFAYAYCRKKKFLIYK